MWRSSASLVGRFRQLRMARLQIQDYGYSTTAPTREQTRDKSEASLKDPSNQALADQPRWNDGGAEKHLSENYVPPKERFRFFVTTFHNLKDNKEDVYGALDACVAWEEKFPVATLRKALLVLQREGQWHRIIQVIKWMLSKGRGNSMGTYKLLVTALDLDNRAEEAHQFWMKKIGTDLHRVRWSLLEGMMSVYFRNNMHKNLVELFEQLETLGRKPKSGLMILQVADAYEKLGSLTEKTKVLEKYNLLLTDKGCARKFEKGIAMRRWKSGRRKPSSTSNGIAKPVTLSKTN